MACFVGALAREYRRLWEIDTYGLPLRVEMETVDAQHTYRLAASYSTPTSEEGWVFLAHVLTWVDDDDPEDISMQRRILDMFERRFDEWLAAT
jgi:hypothetical protein